MDWIQVATISTTGNYVYTPLVTGTLFKLKHIRTNALVKSLKIVIRQAFEDNGVLAFFDYKLISYKTELDIVLFSIPQGLLNRKLAIKRVDNLIEEDWTIEIEQLVIEENGVNLPINISDITNLQLQLDSIQAELTLKALDLELDTHVLSTENPHLVTLNQLGGEPVGVAQSLLNEHKLSVDHPIATIVSDGMFSSEDKNKLNGVQDFSTNNSTDTYLLSRSNHIGEQAIGTVTNLVATLATFVKLTGNQVIEGIKTFSNFALFRDSVQVLNRVTANSYYLNSTPSDIEIARTVTTISNHCADIGFFDIPNGGVTFRLSLVVSDVSFSLAKIYTVVSIYTNADTGWLRLVPIKEITYFAFNNCEIDIRLAQNRTYLRIRRSGGNGDNGTAVIRLEFTGNSTTFFEQTFATLIDSGVTGTY